MYGAFQISWILNFSQHRVPGRFAAPQLVFYLLFFIAAMSMVLVEFVNGVGNCRHLAFTTSVAILISPMILVIIDLDRPQRRLIEASHESMIALRNSLR